MTPTVRIRLVFFCCTSAVVRFAIKGEFYLSALHETVMAEIVVRPGLSVDLHVLDIWAFVSSFGYDDQILTVFEMNYSLIKQWRTKSVLV